MTLLCQPPGPLGTTRVVEYLVPTKLTEGCWGTVRRKGGVVSPGESHPDLLVAYACPHRWALRPASLSVEFTQQAQACLFRCSLPSPYFTKEHLSHRQLDWFAPTLPKRPAWVRIEVPWTCHSLRPIFNMTWNHTSSFSRKCCERNQLIRERLSGTFSGWLGTDWTRTPQL